MDLERLKKETRLDHQAVEDIIPLMRADLTRELYGAVLYRLLGIVEAWEAVTEGGLPGSILPQVRERKRAHLIRQDLADLGRPVTHPPLPILPRFEKPAEWVGALYVIEGSRLGGQFIARHVDTVLGLVHGQGSRYFRGFGDETRSRWVELMRLLENEVSDHETEMAIRGAKKMFSAFAEWMRGMEELSLRCTVPIERHNSELE